ncbi:MAG: ABC transporter permease [Firmicutes bacterium]|nr:ABC transporter permease [Bacillota bacterium]
MEATERHKDSPIVNYERETDQGQEVYVATQWQLIWWRFRRHKLAMVSGVVIVLFYIVALLGEFIAPSVPAKYDVKYNYAPPQRLHFVSEEGFSLRPFVYGYKREIDKETLRRVYVPDESQRYPVYFLVRGEAYRLWGLWETDLHLFGLEDPSAPFFLFGADRMGRDLLTRIIYGTRVSMSIGLIGVVMSFVLGVLIGGVSGYYGGLVDNVIQRGIEFIRSIPTIPLWMALSAALPPHWPPLRVYFGITIILSLIGWTGLARVVRSKFLSLREEDFVIAARLDGCSELRIILRHMIPSFTSHMIAAMTLRIPDMILAETSLSFLGLGLRSPVVSWGVLLQDAQNVRTVAHSPWLLLPGAAVVLTVLAFNFLGDGLRDAADPYAR